MKLNTHRFLIVVLTSTLILIWGFLVEGRELTNKADDNGLTSKTMKIGFGVDPTITHSYGATTSSAAANGDTNINGSADQFANSVGESTDSDHQITIDQYHRMSGNLRPHP